MGLKLKLGLLVPVCIALISLRPDSLGSSRTFFVADGIERGTRRIRMTLQLPEGARRVPTAGERYDEPDPRSWFPAALAPGSAPVDLSFLNRDDRPAGRRGFVRADGDRLAFADGSPARFWGGNLAAYSLFLTPRQEVASQAHRMAGLGFNLMRIHHHDSDWVSPNVFGSNARTTRRLDPRSLEKIDWWIKCLKDEGIYVWLDIHVGRAIKPGDGLTEGADEVARRDGKLAEFCYYNGQLRELMKEFQRDYLNHGNRYTNLRYRDDPAVIGVLITNENDATNHGCYAVLPDKNNPFHNAIWTKGYQAFASRFGLPADRVFQTWLPGPSKLYQAQVEHDFNEAMIRDVRAIGVRAPIATTSFWGNDPLYSLPPLTDGDLIDVHSYGEGEELSKNAHFQGNFTTWIAMAQAYGKPLTVSEWNVEYPSVDRFTGPLFVASIASLQGWDASMIFAYSQNDFPQNPAPEKWSTYHDPSLTAVMPAAALLYRRGHVSPARKTYCFLPDANALFGRALTPNTSATIRTLSEQSRLTIGMPAVRELPWLKPTTPSGDAIVVTDPDHDFIPGGQTFVRSDTGELTRDWELGIQTIDTPRTQAVNGWIGGRTLRTQNASFDVRTKKAVVALTSVDDRPLAESRFILVTAVARALSSPGDKPPFLSEPVRCRITLQTKVADLELLAMGRDGGVVGRPAVERLGDSCTFELPAGRGTHWYVLSARPPRGGPIARRGGRSAHSERVMRMICPPSMRVHAQKVLQGEYDPAHEHPGPVILDIGANIGSFALWAVGRWPGCRLHCYEPLPSNFEMLRSNLSHPPATSVSLYPFAIGDPGRKRLFLGKNNCGEASFFDLGEQTTSYVDVETRGPVARSCRSVADLLFARVIGDERGVGRLHEVAPRRVVIRGEVPARESVATRP